MLRVGAWSFAILICVVGLASAALAEKRVALVIGNSAYVHTTPLKNPGNDASAIGKLLTELGFEVIEGVNLTHREFGRTIAKFSRKLRGADVALVYYAGHGLQVDGRNYLVPVDASLDDDASLAFEAVQLKTVLSLLERQKRTSLVFLDACRNNPLSRNLARSMGTRSVGIGRGFAREETGVGTLIAFATQPGNVALDGEGKHSPFTSALLNHLDSPGTDVALVMRQVRQDVISASSGHQVPWSSSSLTAPFVFKAKPKITAKHMPLQAAPQRSKEFTFWDSARQFGTKEAYDAYLTRFPKGDFAELARMEVNKIARHEKMRKTNEAARMKREQEERIRKQAEDKQRIEEERRKAEAERAEIAAWKVAEVSSDEMGYRNYLKRYPKGTRASLARFRIDDIKRQAILETDRQKRQKEVQEIAKLRADLEKQRKLLSDSLKQAEAAAKYRSTAQKKPSIEQKDLADQKKSLDSQLKKLDHIESKKVAALETGTPAQEQLRPDPYLLAIAAQSELKRVGCEPGKIDGNWGNGSRSALAKFGLHAKIKLASTNPSQEIIDLLRARKERVCPISCGAGTVLQSGKCVAKQTPTKSKTKTKTATKKPSSSGKKRYSGGLCKDGNMDHCRRACSKGYQKACNRLNRGW